jgi:hypothetical protein
VEFGVNSSYHAAIGTTPFMMDYGQTPLAPNMLDVARTNPSAKKFVGQCEKRVKKAKETCRVAQQRAKQHSIRQLKLCRLLWGIKSS